MNNEINPILKSAVMYRAWQRPHDVLLTATITPPRTAVARSDPAERLQDYARALKYYLTLPAEIIGKVLFIDNSDSDLSYLAKIVDDTDHRKQVELLSFNGNNHPIAWGKAYGEFKLMDFGLEHSQMSLGDDVIWKVTGRLIFANLAPMIEASRRSFDLMCDLHNIPWIGTGRWHDNHYMDLRTFAFNSTAWDRLFHLAYDKLEDRFEGRYLYDVVCRARTDLMIIPRFPLQPQFIGVSGRHNRAYDAGLQRTKTRLRGALRKATPWLWI